MMLPELTSRIKALLPSLGGPVQTLDLKGGAASTPNEWYVRNGFYGIASKLAGLAPSWSGETVNLDTALNLSTVMTCKRIIAESTGFLPLVMMQKQNGAKREATEKPMYGGLLNAPNDETTAQSFRETETGHVVMGGDAFSQIVRRSGTQIAMELRGLLPEQVGVDREMTGEKRLVYVVKDGNGASKTYTVQRGKPQDILHIRGLGWSGTRGYSVLSMARQSWGTALSAERHVGRFYARGGRLPYNLTLDRDFETDQEAEKFRDDWNKLYGNPNEAPILPPWIKYDQTGMSLIDSQMLESRAFSVQEICRWFRVSPHLAGDLTHATFSNIEQLMLEFVNLTLHVWLKRWEQELWRCVLTPEEKQQGYFWRHNVRELLRGDFLTRMQGYSVALQNGFLSQNEVRDEEDRNPFEGGDEYHIQLNMQQLPSSGNPPQTQQQPGSLVRLGSGAKYRRVA